MINGLLVFSLLFGFLVHAQEGSSEREERQKIEGTETLKAVKARREQEERAETLAYAFRPHKPSYILPLSYNPHPNPNTIEELGHVENYEVKMQFSFKFDVFGRFWNDTSTFMFGYTNLAFWQLYNNRFSAPFRETNHEPEFFYTYSPSGMTPSESNQSYRIGFVHQSNGQGGLQSRSWNRVYVQAFATVFDIATSLKIWHRLEEDPKRFPTDVNGDDNPKMTTYMGNFELMASKKFSENTVTLLLRNNLRQDNRGAFEFSWSFPLNERFKGYFQYFNGHGESLIDYDYRLQRLSLGLLVADWI